MTKTVSSVSRAGTDEPWELQVSREHISYHETNYKFGFNPLIDDAQETVWAKGGLYTYLSSASTLYVSSSSGLDDVGNTGATSVTVSGLDADYKEKSVSVNLDGQNGVELGEFIRVNRAVITAAGSGGTNAGNIHVGTESSPTSGVPATSYAYIAAGDGQTLMALWTVPANYKAYLNATTITTATEANNKFATIELVARPFGEVFQIKNKFVVTNDANYQTYVYPISFDEKTDIEVRGIGSSTNANVSVSAGLDFIYIVKDPDIAT